MKRREFVAGLCGAAAWPVAARAQQVPLPVAGFFSAGSRKATKEDEAFRRGLAEAGYVDGRNLVSEYYWAEGRYERLPLLAAELVKRQVSVIIAYPTTAAIAAKAATATIPIVFTTGFDPVRFGLVASFNRPGGNATGVTYLTGQLGAKKLDLFRQLVPNATLIAVLVNPTNPMIQSDRTELTDLHGAAQFAGRELIAIEASSEAELDVAFKSIVQRDAGALIVSADTFFVNQAARIAELATRSRIPAIYESRMYTEVGGLMSYGPDFLDQNRLAGVYAGRILKGEKPADLPVLQPTKLEFVINLKTARALGLEIPPQLLAIADEVIE
jgi:putative tryptophan/tyrosine transport system substrate-binding protein